MCLFGEISHCFQMDLEIVSDVIYHPSLALRAQLLRRCSRRAFCFAMLSGRAHRRDNVQVMGNADWGARLRTRKDTTAALKALRCSALVERNCRVWHNWSNGAAVGALPQAPQGAPPLDPFWAARRGRFSILPLPQIFLSLALPLFPPPHILPLEGRGISPLQERE